MTQIKGFIVIGFLTAFTFLVSACNPPPITSATNIKMLPSGYSCLATNPKYNGYMATAWAKHLFRAKKKALMRCRLHSRIDSACKIRSCRWVAGSAISTTGYFTCYATNKSREGIWLSTSHNEYEAKNKALYRCHRFSGAANNCYFDHCVLW